MPREGPDAITIHCSLWCLFLSLNNCSVFAGLYAIRLRFLLRAHDGVHTSGPCASYYLRMHLPCIVDYLPCDHSPFLFQKGGRLPHNFWSIMAQNYNHMRYSTAMAWWFFCLDYEHADYCKITEFSVSHIGWSGPLGSAYVTGGQIPTHLCEADTMFDARKTLGKVAMPPGISNINQCKTLAVWKKSLTSEEELW